MKRFFIVTYFAHFESTGLTKHHCVYKYYIWNAPVFFEWICERRKEFSKEYDNPILINCGKY